MMRAWGVWALILGTVVAIGCGGGDGAKDSDKPKDGAASEAK